MPNQRKRGKRMVGFYADEDEARGMMRAAAARGMTLADWLRSLIPSKEEEKKKLSQSPKKKKRVATGSGNGSSPRKSD